MRGFAGAFAILGLLACGPGETAQDGGPAPAADAGVDPWEEPARPVGARCEATCEEGAACVPSISDEPGVVASCPLGMVDGLCRVRCQSAGDCGEDERCVAAVGTAGGYAPVCEAISGLRVELDVPFVNELHHDPRAAAAEPSRAWIEIERWGRTTTLAGEPVGWFWFYGGLGGAFVELTTTVGAAGRETVTVEVPWRDVCVDAPWWQDTWEDVTGRVVWSFHPADDPDRRLPCSVEGVYVGRFSRGRCEQSSEDGAVFRVRGELDATWGYGMPVE